MAGPFLFAEGVLMYNFIYINSHVEVYRHGHFILSADTKAEAIKEIEGEN